MKRVKVHVHYVNEHYKGMVRTDLASGAVAFGETHSKPHARQMAKCMITDGVVKQLFLEIPNWGYEKNFAIAAGSGNAVSVASDIKGACAAAFRLNGKIVGSNGITFNELITFAISSKVEVHCFDEPNMDAKRRTSKEGMNARDQFMSSYYRAHVKNSGVGALLLNGAMHLTHRHDYSTRSLASLCRIKRVYLFAFTPLHASRPSHTR